MEGLIHGLRQEGQAMLLLNELKQRVAAGSCSRAFNPFAIHLAYGLANNSLPKCRFTILPINVASITIIGEQEVCSIYAEYADVLRPA